jgi:hypothetical protein
MRAVVQPGARRWDELRCRIATSGILGPELEGETGIGIDERGGE